MREEGGVNLVRWEGFVGGFRSEHHDPYIFCIMNLGVPGG